MKDTESFIKTCIASPNCWNMSSTSSSSMETEVLVKAFTTFGSCVTFSKIFLKC